MQELKYPNWPTNVIMVKKELGDWRMYTDFTNLTLACPNDNYPLPSIDSLIDRSFGCKVLNFMDAYLGYNQIKMNKEHSIINSCLFG